MRREQEDVAHARFVARTKQPFRTSLRWPEQAERIGQPMGLGIRYRRRIMRLRELKAGLPKPAKIRRAGIVEEGLTWSEPAPHPLRPYLCI